MKKIIKIFLLLIIVMNINSFSLFSDDIPSILKIDKNEFTIYQNEKRFKKEFLANKKILSILPKNGGFFLLYMNDSHRFHSADSNETNFEDIDWKKCKRYGKDIHKNRIFPKLFRSLDGPIWNFNLEKNEISKIDFDKSGRYLPGSSRGGIIIIGTHIIKSDVIEKWGAPVGGLYRIGFGYWFHNASDIDLRYGYDEIGNLYMRQLAIRNCDILLDKYDKSGKKVLSNKKISEINQYRIITFVTGSDGIPYSGVGKVINGKLESDKIFFDTINNSIDILKIDRGKKLYFQKVMDGKILKNCKIIPSKNLFYIGKENLIKNVEKIKSIKLSIKNGEDKIYLTDHKLVRVSNNWFKNGGIFYYFNKNDRRLYFNIEDEKFKKSVKFESSIIDYYVNSLGDIYLLTDDSNVDLFNDNREIYPEKMVELNPRIEFIDQTRKNLKEKFEKRTGEIKMKFYYKKFLSLSKLSHSIIGTYPIIRNNYLHRKMIYKIVKSKVKYSRTARYSKKKNKWTWLNPPQIIEGGNVVKFKILPNDKVIVPPVNRGDGYVVDINIGKNFEKSNELFFSMENFPQFNRNGLNDKSALYDENNNGIAGGVMNNIIENSIIYKWEIDKYEKNNWYSLKDREVYKVKNDFDYNSKFLRDNEFKNFSRFSLIKDDYPFFYKIDSRKLHSGKYRVKLTIFFDYYDFNSPNIDRNNLEKIRKSYTTLNYRKLKIKLSGNYEFKIK